MEVYFSLGTNIGDRMANISAALGMMDKALGACIRRSSVIETEPWGFESGSMFLNCVAVYETDMPCTEILSVCKEIERRMGREEKIEYDPEGKRVYHSRIMDIDILFYGCDTVDLPELKVPHPLISIRDFVMTPLMEVADDSIMEAFPVIFKEN